MNYELISRKHYCIDNQDFIPTSALIPGAEMVYFSGLSGVGEAKAAAAKTI
jgi:hypothetical protein